MNELREAGHRQAERRQLPFICVIPMCPPKSVPSTTFPEKSDYNYTIAQGENLGVFLTPIFSTTGPSHPSETPLGNSKLISKDWKAAGISYEGQRTRSSDVQGHKEMDGPAQEDGGGMLPSSFLFGSSVGCMMLTHTSDSGSS